MTRPGPQIGISASDPNCPNYRIFAAAVEAAGGSASLLTWDATSAKPDLPMLQGLILTGGGDLHASLYGEEERIAPRSFSRARDDFELEWCAQARKRGLPTLGVCRGLQVMVVESGGGLYQHLQDDMPAALPHESPDRRGDFGHLVAVKEGTRLAAAMGAGELFVSTSHHQAPRNLGEGLQACAWSPDGVIEAAEAPGEAFFVGVEWHPERMWETRPEQFGLIKALLAAAREFRGFGV